MSKSDETQAIFRKILEEDAELLESLSDARVEEPASDAPGDERQNRH
jgi:hypothetical protein